MSSVSATARRRPALARRRAKGQRIVNFFSGEPYGREKRGKKGGGPDCLGFVGPRLFLFARLFRLARSRSPKPQGFGAGEAKRNCIPQSQPGLRASPRFGSEIACRVGRNRAGNDQSIKNTTAARTHRARQARTPHSPRRALALPRRTARAPPGATFGSTFSIFVISLPGVARPARLRERRPLYPGLEAERPLARRAAWPCSAVGRLLFISSLTLLLYCSRYYFLAQRWVRTAAILFLMRNSLARMRPTLHRPRLADATHPTSWWQSKKLHHQHTALRPDRALYPSVGSARLCERNPT